VVSDDPGGAAPTRTSPVGHGGTPSRARPADTRCVQDRHGSHSRWAAKFGGRQRLILFLAADVSDIAVLFIAILEEDRTVEVLIVIVVRLG
jgi:hypothetical protein